jgi:hypothetical protein
MPAIDPVEYDETWIRDRRLTMIEIADYKKITRQPPCLICGRRLRKLSGHLFSKHGMSIAEYREFYGIPRFMKITDCETREKHKRDAEQKQRDGILTHSEDPNIMNKLREIKRKMNRPEVKSYNALQNCKQINKNTDGKRGRILKIVKTHTEEDTRQIQSNNAMRHKQFIKMNEKNAEKGWIKTDEHEARRLFVIRKRAEIRRSTPKEHLESALAKFKIECQEEYKRRRLERRKLKLKTCEPNVKDNRAEGSGSLTCWAAFY